ncbi:hypothetical protein G7Z17_g4747 [Cylindrodendrum hubeiense]|uniref:Uncharacterized protein n=1 Tax=Cylindrodendrum hubeiense TaxID=595255 RepID=A0A9P5LGW1_9HYPO|nr:hypothetical protein G7Z17_g4747 [Cylindrodendrum hubeiense]
MVSAMEYSAPVKPTRVIRGKMRGLWTSTVHLIPLALTAFLLYINFAGLYWFRVSGMGRGLFHISPSNILNSLQLAAKLYELFVVASLAAITLKAYKRRLVSTGVPFGLLSGAYRVGDVMYIFSSKFWGGWRYAGWLAALLLSNTLLSILVGPASAILIVPELRWFRLPNAFSNVNMPILLQTPATMWPTILNQSLWETSPLCLEMGSFLPLCPAAGFATIYTWASGWAYTGMPNNITFQDPSGTARRRLHMWSDPNSGTFVTSVSDFATTTVGQFKSYIKTGDVGAISETENYKLTLSSSTASYQPLVNSKCNVWNLEDYESASDVPDMDYPSKELNCFSASDDDYCARMRKQLQSWMATDTSWRDQTGIMYQFSVIADEQNSDNATLSSLVFYARLPYIHGAGDSFGMRVAACSFMPHWIPSTMVVDPSNTDLVESNITDLSIFGNDNWKENQKKVTVGPVIRIKESFLPYLSLGDYQNQDSNSTADNSTDIFSNVGSLFMAMMLTYTNTTGQWYFFGPGSSQDSTFESDDDDTVRVVMEKFTGAIVADSIARISAGAVPLLLRPSDSGNGSMRAIDLATRQGPSTLDSELLPNGTGISSNGVTFQLNMTLDKYVKKVQKEFATLDFKAEQYGYGYGQPGGSMTFALTVIFAYIFMLFLYWIVVLCRRSHTVAAWDDLQDLIALAWSSPAPADLKGQGAKVADKDLWKESVSVKATSSRYVMLTMDEQPGLTKLKRNEGYW